jgi:tetratricopeptide (TPR) repeat protein
MPLLLSLREAGDPTVHYSLGVIEYSRKNTAAALGYFDAALAETPPDANTLYYAGLCSRDLGDRDRAIGHLRRALSLKPEFARARQELKSLGASEPSKAHGVGAAPQARPAQAPQPTPAAGVRMNLEPGKQLHDMKRRVRSLGLFWVGIALVLATLPLLYVLNHWHRFEDPPPTVPTAGVVARGEGVSVVALQASAAPRAFDAHQLLTDVIFGFPLAGLALLVYSIIRCRTDRFVVYEHQLALHEGFLFRRAHYAWMFEIVDVALFSNPMLITAGSSGMKVVVNGGKALKVCGFGTSKRVMELSELVRNQSVHERHDVKDRFI